MEHTASQKRQNNVTNNPTAAQLVHPDTPGPPLRVKSRALNLGMQTQGLRYDQASSENKGIIQHV